MPKPTPRFPALSLRLPGLAETMTQLNRAGRVLVLGFGLALGLGGIVVPEPAVTALLIGAGTLALALARRRFRQGQNGQTMPSS